MKFKRLISIIIAAVMLFSLASCGSGSDDAPDGMKVLEQASGSYTVYVPQDWIADVSTGFASAYASSTDPSNVSFMAYEVPTDETTPDGKPVTDIETFWQSYEKDFEKSFSDIEYESFGEEKAEDGSTSKVNYTKVKMGGLEARKYILHATVAGDEYDFIIVVAVHSMDAFLLTYTATRDNFDKHLDEFDQIMENIKFN